MSFGLLPIPLIVCLFLGSVVLMFKATGLFDWSEHKGALPEPNWTVISFWYYSTGYVASALVAALFCWLARRSHCRFKWAGITCGLLSLHGLMFGSGMTIPYATDNGAFWVGYYSKSLDLLGMVTPLSVLFIFFLVSVREFNSYGVDHQKEVA